MNIAQVQKEIDNLRKQREEIYVAQITPIEFKIAAHKQFIKARCHHHEDFLLVEETYETDEYDKHCPSWDKVIVTCSVCDKQVTVNREKFRETECDFRDLMLLSNEDLEEL